MSLKQFGSITDLLSKLRADLRASFPRFVNWLLDVWIRYLAITNYALY